MLWAVPGSFCFALFSSHTIAFSFADSHFSSLSRTSLSQLYFRYISHHFSICFSSTTFFSTLTLHDLDSILHILLLYYTSVAQQHLENSVADKVSIVRIPHPPYPIVPASESGRVAQKLLSAYTAEAGRVQNFDRRRHNLCLPP